MGQAWGVYYSYSTVPKIYGSKQTEYKGIDRGLTDRHKTLVTCSITIVYPTHVCTCARFTVASILFTHLTLLCIAA